MVSKEELRKKYKLKVLLRGPTGTGKCCKGNTLILTDKGLIKIEDLVYERTDINNKERGVDEDQTDLLDHLGELDNEGYSDNVKNVNSVISISPKLGYKPYDISAKYNMGESDSITVKTSIGFEITGTPEHKVVVINEDGNLVFKKLENIRTGDSVAITYNTNIFNNRLGLHFWRRPDGIYGHYTYELKNIEYMNKDIARLLGYMIAEGSCGFRDKDQDEAMFMTMTNYDQEIIDDALDICKNINVDVHKEKEDEKIVGVRINSIMFVDFMYYLGYRHGAKNKEIPWSILQADKECQIEFLKALFDSDGTIYSGEDHDVVEYYNSSYELCRQLQLVLLNIGIISRVNKKKGAVNEYRGEIREYEESYRLSIGGEDILKFSEIIDFGLTRKKEILNGLVEKLKHRDRWTNITYPNIDKKLSILYDKLKFLGKSYSLYIRDGERVKYFSAKSYLQYHGFEKSFWAYISGERQPSKLTLKKILDILSPTKDMEIYKYLQLLSDTFIFDKVEDIKKGRDNVYDVTIDNVHSYIGNGIINHNTYSAVKIAEYVASKGWKVLFLDHERGSSEELDKLDDKALDNIIHEDFKNYQEIMDAIKKHRLEQKEKLKLIIIDPMYLIEMSRLSARDAFLEQGYYWLGEKKVDIDNKETFDLRGFMYQLATTYQSKLLNEVVSCEQDIIVTLMTPNKHETDYDGKFSIVLETFNAWIGNKVYYKAIPKKFRGVDLSTMPAIDDPYKKLLEGFIRKYSSLGSPYNVKIETSIEDNKEGNNEEEGNIGEKEDNDVKEKVENITKSK